VKSVNLHKIKSLILDMDGVLWRDCTPIGDLQTIFMKIKERRLDFVLATNNSSKTPEMYQKKLMDFGVEVNPEQIVTSSMAVAELLKKKYPSGGPVFIVGEEGITSLMQKYGFFHQEEDPLAIIAGLDRQISYEKLSKATLFIRNGAEFYGTNPDKTYPTDKGLVPGAGAIIAFLETASGVTPIIAGKPYPYLLIVALSQMRSSPSETLVIGDRLETDIAGGKNVNCRTALVLSGVSSQEDLNCSTIIPDMIAMDLAEIIDSFNK
jgi:4-nitrophenyl phosphatase